MNNKNRIEEKELITPALKALSASASGFLSTTDLIAKLSMSMNPDGKDAQLLSGRNDNHFSQKVRNLVSHRHLESSPFSCGYMEYDDQRSGIQITDLGRQKLIA